jgi:hypothetical protein
MEWTSHFKNGTHLPVPFGFTANINRIQQKEAHSLSSTTIDLKPGETSPRVRGKYIWSCYQASIISAVWSRLSSD